MRRWNGWGDDSVAYPIDPHALDTLRAVIGAGIPPVDVSLHDVLAQVPTSHLPPHPLITNDPVERVRHSRGQSLPDLIALRSGHNLTFPDGVAFPCVPSDVRSLIEYCTDVGARLIPFGGGTSVVGHVNVLESDAPTLTVDMSRMSDLRFVDEESHLATFGAGINGAVLEASLHARGLTLGHFPQSFEYSTLGGWIATRSKGQQSAHYGGIERLFAGGRVETPVGTIQLPVHPESAAGPNLHEIILGSEGRLGIVTEATVRVAPLARAEEFRTLFFPDFDRGMNAVRRIAQSRLPFSMLRLSDEDETRTTLALAGSGRSRDALKWLLGRRGIADSKCMLTFGVTGRRALVDLTVQQVTSLSRACGGVEVVGKRLGDQWRKARFRAPYLRNALWEHGYAVDTVETAVEWSMVSNAKDVIRVALENALRGEDERVYVFAHLSHVYATGSSIYTTFVYRLGRDPEQTLHRWRLLKDAASEAVMQCGGTISHQHGVGSDHLPFMTQEKGELGVSAIRLMCQQFDPNGIMNPGKLVD